VRQRQPRPRPERHWATGAVFRPG